MNVLLIKSERNKYKNIRQVKHYLVYLQLSGEKTDASPQTDVWEILLYYVIEKLETYNKLCSTIKTTMRARGMTHESWEQQNEQPKK